MFWKRKPKKQDGQEATDSAAEVAEDTTEETEDDAVESKDAKAAEKNVRVVDEADAEDAPADSESEKTDAGDSEPEKAEAEETRDADAASDEAGGSEDDRDEADADKDDAEAEADAEDSAADAGSEKTDTDSADASEDEDDEVVEVGVTGPDSDGIIRVRTAGTFEFDGEKYDIISNTWIIEADKDGVVIIDPAHDAEAIMEAVGDREVYLVACTNGYSPHIESALAIAQETEADIALHPREMRAWRRLHGAEHRPEIDVEGEGALDIGDLHIDVLALPGTTNGSLGYYVSQLGAVFSGDTLRKGEPGMVGNTYIDYTTQLASIGEGLLSLPPDTRVLPDRGPSTTVEAEGRNFDSWV